MSGGGNGGGSGDRVGGYEEKETITAVVLRVAKKGIGTKSLCAKNRGCAI